MNYFYNIFSLSPKTYFAYDADTNNIKKSSKGIQHRVDLRYLDYKRALYNDKIVDVKNTVLRVKNDVMCTMSSEKIGLKNVLVKACVKRDRVTVEPFKKFL